jgi:hypothetical protein
LKEREERGADMEGERERSRGTICRTRQDDGWRMRLRAGGGGWMMVRVG